MRRLLLMSVIWLSIASLAPAQSTRRGTPSAPERGLQPQLRQAEISDNRDEMYEDTAGQRFYFRSGSNIPLPQTEGAPLLLGLDAPLSTDGMVGIVLHRDLILRSALQTPYGGIYSTTDGLVETRVSGHKSGFRNQSVLVVEPYLLQIVVRESNYTQVDVKNGLPVYLKPGQWKLALNCSIESIENPEGGSWKAQHDSEGVVKGGKFRFQSKSLGGEDHFGGLLYIQPLGSVAYGISQLGGVVGFFFHRPNIKLPVTTQLHFHIDQMRGSYLSTPTPKGPVKIVR